jgi:hypothetical protein
MLELVGACRVSSNALLAVDRLQSCFSARPSSPRGRRRVPARRGLIAFAALLSVAACGTSTAFAPATAVASGGYRSCDPKPRLSGRLQAKGISCATARRVTLGYFGSTPPGDHTRASNVMGFSCTASIVPAGAGRASFEIECRRAAARSKFVGVVA